MAGESIYVKFTLGLKITSLQALRAWILELEISVHQNRLTGKVFFGQTDADRQTDRQTDANRTDGAAQIVL